MPYNDSMHNHLAHLIRIVIVKIINGRRRPWCSVSSSHPACNISNRRIASVRGLSSVSAGSLSTIRRALSMLCTWSSSISGGQG